MCIFLKNSTCLSISDAMTPKLYKQRAKSTMSILIFVKNNIDSLDYTSNLRLVVNRQPGSRQRDSQSRANEKNIKKSSVIWLMANNSINNLQYFKILLRNMSNVKTVQPPAGERGIVRLSSYFVYLTINANDIFPMYQL